MQRQLEATLSRALELNDRFFQQERDKLEAWAEDRIASAEQALNTPPSQPQPEPVSTPLERRLVF